MIDNRFLCGEAVFLCFILYTLMSLCFSCVRKCMEYKRERKVPCMSEFIQKTVPTCRENNNKIIQFLPFCNPADFFTIQLFCCRHKNLVL